MAEQIRIYNVNRMPPEVRQKAWFAIKRDHPALAEFMRSDAYRRLHQVIGAEVIVRINRSGRIIPLRGKKKT